MTGDEFNVAGFKFTTNFDSGNLARVELLDAEPKEECVTDLNPRPSTSTLHQRCVGAETPDYEFQLWTRTDCQNTEFENGNRTWFYFGLEEGPPGAVIRFTLMNLNKQSKLFSQGMCPVYLAPGKSQWERIRDPPTYETVEHNFRMSFKFRNPETRTGTTYFAFTYPYTYKELQTNLDKLYRKHGNGMKSFTELSSLPTGAVYFHRENVIRSLEKRRMDLLTISGMNGILEEKEVTLSNLFLEESDNRPYMFEGKTTVFISARVHPGETCSSHVMNGLLRFLLRENDVRAAVLRKKYVFKLVPMLNPDGVFNGHYRTDTRGVNLNRVYSNPSILLHPTIYAARKLVLYAHLGRDVEEETSLHPSPPLPTQSPLKDTTVHNDIICSDSESVKDADSNFTWEVPTLRNKSYRTSSSSSRTSSLNFPTLSPYKHDYGSQWYEMTENSRCSEGDESIADFSVTSHTASPSKNVHGLNVEESASFDFLPPAKLEQGSRTDFLGAFNTSENPNNLKTEGSSKENNDLLNFDAGPTFPKEHGDSGLFMYLDIHGHASKRGIFIYGNHFSNIETKVNALLFPKLMSINSANFDFPACNFSQRNMILKDRHTGAGREGSGRVSVYRATGITYCYTLECNFNTGRFTNNIPMASRDGGRASPPPIYDIPPKYSPITYEDTGKSLAVSILDLTESNPWTRLTCSSSKTLKGVRNSVRNYIKSAEAEIANKIKSSKASPIRTRLRNMTGLKKSAVKQLKLSVKSPSSPEGSRSLSKIPRKILSTKNSQSASGKLSRQLSSSSVSRSVETPSKRPRPGSSKVKKSGLLDVSKPVTKPALNPVSKSNSRASSPRRNKTESRNSKLSKGKGQKKLIKRSSIKGQGQETSPIQPLTPTQVKKIKKKIIPKS